MNGNIAQDAPKQKFSKAFWVANTAELLERAAYYGVFVVLSLYLSNVLGFTDIGAGFVAGIYSAVLYFLPPFTGALADRMGFRKAMLLAFGLLALGYVGAAVVPGILQGAGLVDYGGGTVFTGLVESGAKYAIVPALLLAAVGGSFIKGVVSGTVARETDEKNRARGFAIFYMMVNAGSFLGKFFVDPLRISMGDRGLIILNYLSAGMVLIAFLAIYFFYRTNKHQGQGKSLREVWRALVNVFKRGRLISLILIVSGFWVVYYQLYATMPKYVIRLAGDAIPAAWLSLINPFVILVSVGLITRLFGKKKALTSIMIGMLIVPIAPLLMSMGTLFDAPILGLHPVAFMMIAGIVFQALAETFINPRYLEFFSLQSPKGEEAMYLGFANLDSFFSVLIGFIMSGFLLDRYLPDPKKFATAAEWEAASANAGHIWYYFAAIAAFAALAFVIYVLAIKRIDRRKTLRETER